ncbi:phosphatidylinositol 3-kinase-related protein kinase [Heterostelium album PN500]|uniref:Phosphatidylinositol 3-kinase-related protein kinase n=1 Tax=Heterostelium pallidum (strain ATCC 26659 / Pp 5 / PN500) TaxID=670386 RepID=D3B3J7_HETP5|nr:phosphatidylinositol 3-kinase-related protein kinase [Heterostelium album PN500]EFA83895.1 phosphatidylinositol 3-kinase-related protein kinase [Heterostelium album PN500]|eukprot:XP_020436012.1 phosphatidylinositol 3-kinase-related protein kinase [Heterostelium album PN500]
MVSIAPTPLYLPVEEANKIFKSPIPQRREFTAFSSAANVNTIDSSTTELAKSRDSSVTNSNEIDHHHQHQHHISNLAPPSHNTAGGDSDLTLNRYYIGPKIAKTKHHYHHQHHNHHAGNYHNLKPDVNQKSLIEKTVSGLCKFSPILSEGNGLGGGVYFMKSQAGKKVAVFKPKDEENGIISPVAHISSNVKNQHNGLKNGTIQGEGIFKEVAAYLFDQRLNGYFGVPTTTLVEASHPYWKDSLGQQVQKIGSLQEYIDFDDSAEEVGCSKFSVADVHKIGLFDCLMFNCDRHSGNMLVEYDDLDQSKVPFDKKTRELILSIDIDSEIRYLRSALPELRIQCLETLKITTLFVQKAIKKNMTLHQIGKMISRFSQLDQPSSLESIVNEVTHVKGNRISLNNQIFWFDYQKEIDLHLNLVESNK